MPYPMAGEAARLLQEFNDYVSSTDVSAVTCLGELDAQADASPEIAALVDQLVRLLDAVATGPVFDVITAAVDASQAGAHATPLAAIDADLTTLGALIV